MGVFFCVLAVAWGAAVSLTDARTRRIPNVLALPAVLVTWGLCALAPWWQMEWPGWLGEYWLTPVTVIGGAGWWLLIVLLGLHPRMKSGAGDAKLAATLGVIAAGSGGVEGWLFTVALSGLLSAAYGAKTGSVRGVPQGPSMVGATLLVAVCVTVVGAL